jgi:chromosome segregation ATPase
VSESNVRMLRDLQARLAQLTRPSDPNNAPPASRDGRPGDIVSQLETLVGLVQTSQKVIDTLVATIREHEEASYDMKRMLSEEAAQKEAAYQQAAKVETAIRVEKERADVAEARANSAEEELKILERREAIIHKHIDWLIAGVGNLTSTAQIKSPLMASIVVPLKGAANRAA